MRNIYNDIIDKLKENNRVIMISELENLKGNLKENLKREIIQDSKLCTKYKGEITESLSKGYPKVVKKEEGLAIIEPFFPMERLIILGGGHIALPLVEFAAKIGFYVTVVDDRLSFANEGRFPLAKQVLCESFEKCFDTLKITKSDYIVVITRGHRHDADCLKQILKKEESAYLGMIGSRHRVNIIKNQLIQEGYDEQRINNIFTPIGLKIGAITPEEIAISILAQVISRKRLELDNKLEINRSDLDFDVMQELANGNKTQKSLVCVISSKGSVPRGAGAKMIVYSDGKILGSIGGGCSEAAVIQDARDIIGTGRYKIIDIDLTGDSAEDEGMVCGGVMQVLIEDIIDA